MTITIQQRQECLDQFLKEWPIERLKSMTLAEYSSVGDKNSLVYWLEFGAGLHLGSIKGGDSAKFGIYERKAEPKGQREFISSDETHSWKNKYGSSAESAFSVIKKNILDVINAIQAGDLDTIEQLDFESNLKWKLAFIYQDHAKPLVLPIYKLNKFKHFMAGKRKYTHTDAYTALLINRQGKSALEYGYELWQKADALEGKNSDNLDTLDAEDERYVSHPSTPLNQILFGPPGTGKTYETIQAAVQAAEPSFSWNSRDELKLKYQELVDTGRIVFVTFHQSYSYEDFVEGLTASSENGQIQYAPKNGVFKNLVVEAKKQQYSAEQSSVSVTRKNFVLVIDEINRGNISRIFGELITLIEPSKRLGNSETLEVQLPLTGDRFSVPDNLYIIGTMNTADRSLAGLDIALRRRFTFKEMPPKPELLDDVWVDDVNIGELLRIMNQRIAVLLDRDHCLGHAYFMPLHTEPTLTKLAEIFGQNIIPLLQEYFFEDWERIRWVLNDQSKANNHQFIVQDSALNLSQLFPKVHDKLPQSPQWTLNHAAFDHPKAYLGILASAEETEG